LAPLAKMPLAHAAPKPLLACKTRQHILTDNRQHAIHVHRLTPSFSIMCAFSGYVLLSSGRLLRAWLLVLVRVVYGVCVLSSVHPIESACFHILHHTRTQSTALPHSLQHCNIAINTALHCNTLQHTTAHCSTLQHCPKECDTW